MNSQKIAKVRYLCKITMKKSDKSLNQKTPRSRNRQLLKFNKIPTNHNQEWVRARKKTMMMTLFAAKRKT